MDIVLNIPQENCNQNETQLLAQQFKDFNIEIYGTFEEPLFRAKDIGDLLGIKNIRESIKNFNHKQKCDVSLTDAIGREQITTFLSEMDFIKF
jgi:prophage antirepressor-like protein